MSRKEETRSELNEDDLIFLCGGRDIAQGREGEDEEKARQSRCSSHLLPLNASRADAQIGGSGAVFIYNQRWRCGQALEAMDRGAERRTNMGCATLNVWPSEMMATSLSFSLIHYYNFARFFP